MVVTERILVPVDGSPLSSRAVERVARNHPDADVIVLHVIDPVGALYEAEAGGVRAAEHWYDRARASAEQICADAAAVAADHDCAVTTVVETGHPARTILDAVDERDVDHVVMGSHGRRGVSRLVLGSVAERVVRQCPVPVTIVR